MADYVRFFWLADGQLPLFPTPPGGRLLYMAGGHDDREDPKLRWHPAVFRARNAIIPVLDTTLRDFLRFMEEPNEIDIEGDHEDLTLYVALRGSSRHECAEADGDWLHELFLAAAIVPGIVEGAVKYPWQMEPLNQLAQLCMLADLEEAPDDPILRPEWRKMGERREAHRRQREVQDRAKKLLESHLDDDQLAEFKKRHRFRVTDENGLRYMVMYGSHGNVFRIAEDGDKLLCLVNYCHVPLDEELPIYDQMLAQKLLIECDLTSFLSVANATVNAPRPEEERAKDIPDHDPAAVEETREQLVDELADCGVDAGS